MGRGSPLFLLFFVVLRLPDFNTFLEQGLALQSATPRPRLLEAWQRHRRRASASRYFIDHHDGVLVLRLLPDATDGLPSSSIRVEPLNLFLPLLLSIRVEQVDVDDFVFLDCFDLIKEALAPLFDLNSIY